MKCDQGRTNNPIDNTFRSSKELEHYVFGLLHFDYKAHEKKHALKKLSREFFSNLFWLNYGNLFPQHIINMGIKELVQGRIASYQEKKPKKSQTDILEKLLKISGNSAVSGYYMTEKEKHKKYVQMVFMKTMIFLLKNLNSRNIICKIIIVYPTTFIKVKMLGDVLHCISIA